MKKIKLVLLFLILGFFVLIGCSTEEVTPSFSLRELASVALDNEDIPVMYIVNTDGTKNEVKIGRAHV